MGIYSLLRLGCAVELAPAQAASEPSGGSVDARAWTSDVGARGKLGGGTELEGVHVGPLRLRMTCTL